MAGATCQTIQARMRALYASLGHSPTARTFRHGGRRSRWIFCTVARWDNGQIVEVSLCDGLAGLMNQTGPSG